MPNDWTPEQKAFLDQLSIEIHAPLAAVGQAIDQQHQAALTAVDQAVAEGRSAMEAMIETTAPAVQAAKAEIEEFTIPEIVHALRATYGPKEGDPPRRRELLEDKQGNLRETVSLDKACEYAARTPRRIKQLIANGTLETRGGKGNRRIVTAKLVLYYPPEN